MYAKNYGSGDSWLPGKITAVHGSMLFTVQLEDGRMVRKHTDQLRSRVESSQETSVTTDSVEDGNELDLPESEHQEVQETPVNSDGDVSSQSSLTETVDPNRTDEPQTENESTTEQSQQDSTQSRPMPRRSGRTRHPPERFEPTV